jgi:Outer membrane protein beta-barrel domain
MSVLIAGASPSHAQGRVRRLEIGGALGAIDLRDSVAEKPFAAALRAGYRFTTTFGIEAELTFCPQNPSGNFGETMVVAGPRAGVRLGPAIVYGRLRAGVLQFGGRSFRAQDGRSRTEPAIDIGATLEYPVDGPVAFRADWGDLIVPFGSEPVRSLPRPARVGTTHNYTGSVGIQLRF